MVHSLMEVYTKRMNLICPVCKGPMSQGLLTEQSHSRRQHINVVSSCNMCLPSRSTTSAPMFVPIQLSPSRGSTTIPGRQAPSQSLSSQTSSSHGSDICLHVQVYLPSCFMPSCAHASICLAAARPACSLRHMPSLPHTAGLGRLQRRDQAKLMYL